MWPVMSRPLQLLSGALSQVQQSRKALELVMSWCRGWMAGAQSGNGQLLYTVWLKCPASCLLKALEKSHTLQLRYVLFTRVLRGDFCSNEPRQRRSTWTSSDNHMRGDNMQRPFPEAFQPKWGAATPSTVNNHAQHFWVDRNLSIGNLVIDLQRCVARSFRTLFLFSQNIAVGVIHILDAITVMQRASGYPLPPGNVFQLLKKQQKYEIWVHLQHS